MTAVSDLRFGYRIIGLTNYLGWRLVEYEVTAARGYAV